MKKILLCTLLFFFSANCFSQDVDKEFTLVSYNIENLFDADGEAIYNDDKPTDRDGNPQYTKQHVLTKIRNAVRVLKEYNERKGPDIIAMVEIESDYTPAGETETTHEFLDKYSSTILEKMLVEDFNSEIADLPSEFLFLKGMVAAGMWRYEMAAGEMHDANGMPLSVQKTVTFSRFPILEKKTKIHELEQARPILETWIDVEGHELVVLNNHWKSGARSWDMEKVRLGNAQVLRHRINELMSENKNVDVILAGDFNNDYNQKSRYSFEKTALNDVLGSTDEEKKVATQNTFDVFNLWYEWPLDKRGSDTYRGKWGTLMQIMISQGLYDLKGIQYVDNSFSVGDFGFNTHSSSGEPKRWSSTFSGSGFSDHLPVSMKFRLSKYPNEYGNFAVNDDEQWQAIDVQYQSPAEYITEDEFLSVNPIMQPDFYDKYVHLKASVTEDYKFSIDGYTYDVYAPTFKIDEVLSENAGTDKTIQFYGRFSQFRGNWQFVIESSDFITQEE